MSDAGLTVLADVAVPVEDVNRDAFAGFVEGSRGCGGRARRKARQRDKLNLRAGAAASELQARSRS